MTSSIFEEECHPLKPTAGTDTHGCFWSRDRAGLGWFELLRFLHRRFFTSLHNILYRTEKRRIRKIQRICGNGRGAALHKGKNGGL